MKSKILVLSISVFCSAAFYFIEDYKPNPVKPEECVFNTVFGEIELDKTLKIETLTTIENSINEGLEWLLKAQHPTGGWGAGFHSNQREMDPHKVPADPATTAMVAMSLLRTGSTLDSGPLQEQLKSATDFLLEALESAPPNAKITDLHNTQIQQKLGDNIDLVLTAQYLTNLLDYLDDDSPLHLRILNVVNKGVDMLQMQLDENGRAEGAGWAGVLQSAFATTFLESAHDKGAWVDQALLEKSKSYQRSNYDPVSEDVKTRDGAGVMLYSVSGSTRASAKQSRKAKEVIKKANDEGLLDELVVNYKNLVKSGISEEEALTLDAADKVYNSAKLKAQQADVMSGFGNNGGEEFMSFLQTGESLIINNDNSWKDWYDSISANLTNIQNNDGSWNGHHCITSPVFCTATCLLILSINNDIDLLMARGETD